MPVYTDSPRYAAGFLPREVTEALLPARVEDPPLPSLLKELLADDVAIHHTPAGPQDWPYLLLSEFSPFSQYDRLIRLARGSLELPDRIVCLAGSGLGFHGFKGRSWAAVPGNLHLAIHLAPEREVDRFQIAFTILAALSVVDALGQIAALEERVRIKWVNDILLEDAKVAGVLAYTQSQGRVTESAALGIGLNVETTPALEPSPFVPAVTSVRKAVPTASSNLQAEIFWKLLEAVNENYRLLLTEGLDPLLERYRALSRVIGEDVTVCTERSDQEVEVIAEGRVLGLGENLELLLEGRAEPVTGGRLVMGTGAEKVRRWMEGAGENRCSPIAVSGFGS